MSTMKIRAKAIKELENEHGRVTPEELVRAAARKAHPLHGDFIWDDAVAAQRHRLDQARQIIASVRVIVTTETRKISSVGYVHDPEAGQKQGYVSTARLRTEEEAAREALNAEIARVQNALERARELAAALNLEEDFRLALDGAFDMTARMRRGLGQEPQVPSRPFPTHNKRPRPFARP